MSLRRLTAAFLLVTLLGAGDPGYTGKSSGPTGEQKRRDGGPQISITELTSLAIFYRKLERSREEANEEKTASLWQEFELLFRALGGDRSGPVYSFDDFRRAYVGDIKIFIPFDKTIPAKDKFVYKLSLLGYSAKEISDIISGRISLQALNKAVKMRQIGYSRQEVSNFLDRAYKKSPGDLLWKKGLPGSIAGSINGPAYLDELAVRFSERQGLPPQLIRAIIKAESNWIPEAVSPKGAIGLMQLMPGTARLLKVDPQDPEQNVEGGVRYFSYLYHYFKDLELALIAYNAGPGYAERYAQGKAALYGETRQYVRTVIGYLGKERD